MAISGLCFSGIFISNHRASPEKMFFIFQTPDLAAATPLRESENAARSPRIVATLFSDATYFCIALKRFCATITGLTS